MRICGSRSVRSPCSAGQATVSRGSPAASTRSPSQRRHARLRGVGQRRRLVLERRRRLVAARSAASRSRRPAGIVRPAQRNACGVDRREVRRDRRRPTSSMSAPAKRRTEARAAGQLAGWNRHPRRRSSRDHRRRRSVDARSPEPAGPRCLPHRPSARRHRQSSRRRRSACSSARPSRRGQRVDQGRRRRRSTRWKTKCTDVLWTKGDGGRGRRGCGCGCRTATRPGCGARDAGTTDFTPSRRPRERSRPEPSRRSRAEPADQMFVFNDRGETIPPNLFRDRMRKRGRAGRHATVQSACPNVLDDAGLLRHRDRRPPGQREPCRDRRQRWTM